MSPLTNWQGQSINGLISPRAAWAFFEKWCPMRKERGRKDKEKEPCASFFFGSDGYTCRICKKTRVGCTDSKKRDPAIILHIHGKQPLAALTWQSSIFVPSCFAYFFVLTRCGWVHYFSAFNLGPLLVAWASWWPAYGKERVWDSFSHLR